MSSAHPDVPPGGRDTAYLAALGAAARAAPTAQARRGYREEAVHEAELCLQAGAVWTELADRLGVTERTLRRWRRETHTVKRQAVTPVRSWLSTTAAAAGQPYRVTEPSTSEPTLGRFRIEVGATFERPPQIIAPARALETQPAIDQSGWRLDTGHDPQAVTVLLLSGHGRDGNLRFDQENQTIRGLFWGTPFTCHTECSVAATEIAALLDKHMPQILHLCAHHAYDGPWLARKGRDMRSRGTSWPTPSAGPQLV